MFLQFRKERDLLKIVIEQRILKTHAKVKGIHSVSSAKRIFDKKINGLVGT